MTIDRLFTPCVQRIKAAGDGAVEFQRGAKETNRFA